MSAPNPFVDTSQPNQADFDTFVYNQGINTAQLPANSPYLTSAFQYAFDNTFSVPKMPGIIGCLAVYNYGMHVLMMTVQDQPGQTYFANYRIQQNLLAFVVGPVISSSDQGTSQTLANPEWANTISISASGLLKTPWGQEYLAYAQQYGPNIVGFN